MSLPKEKELELIEETIKINVLNKCDEGKNSAINEVLQAHLKFEEHHEIARLLESEVGISKDDARTIAMTQKKAYKQRIILEEAALAGLEYFEYMGIIRADSRDFCEKHIDKKYHKSKIEEMKNGSLDPVLPVLIYGGGIKCHHYWEAVTWPNK